MVVSVIRSPLSSFNRLVANATQEVTQQHLFFRGTIKRVSLRLDAFCLCQQRCRRGIGTYGNDRNSGLDAVPGAFTDGTSVDGVEPRHQFHEQQGTVWSNLS